MFMKAGLDMRPARLAPPSRPRREEREKTKEMREGLEKDLNEDNLNNPLVSFDLVSGSVHLASFLGHFNPWPLSPPV